MDKVKSVFDTDEFGDSVDDAIKASYLAAVEADQMARSRAFLFHASLSRPRKLDDEDLCVRDGYRDVLSQFKELQMAGRVLARARAEQYDPEDVEDVDPTTRMDYDYFDAVDDAKRVSERLNAQNAAAQEATSESPARESPARESPARESPARESPARESPARESPSSQSAQ